MIRKLKTLLQIYSYLFYLAPNSLAIRILVLIIFDLILIFFDVFIYYIIANNDNALLLFNNDRALLISLSIGLFFAKNLGQIVLFSFKNKFAFLIKNSLTIRLLEGIFFINYKALDNTNEKDGSLVLVEPNNLILNMLLPAWTLLSDSITLVILCAAFLFMNPWAALTLVFAFGLPIVLLEYYFSKRIAVNGVLRQDAELNMFKMLRSLTNATDDISAMRLEDVFKEKFNKEVVKHSKAISFKAFKQESVKNITELILLFAALVLYLVNTYFLNYNYLTLIASLSFIGYRLIPVLNRSINSIQSLNHGKAALNIIINIVKSSNILIRQNKTTEVKGNVKEMRLIFKNFTLYNGHVLFPFKQILIKRGELFVIHGRSGSGKSTILSSLIHGKGEELSIQICGQNFKGLKFLKNFKIGSLSQLPFVFKSTVKENITVYSNQEELHSLDIKDFSFCLDINEDSALSFDKIESDMLISEDNLSGGQKQRIGLMRALYFGKDILILDEPTSALDSENKRKFIDFIEKKLKSQFIVMVSHDDEIIKLSDKQLNLTNNEK